MTSVLVRRFQPDAMMKAEHAVAIRTFDYLAAASFGAVAALSSWYLMPEVLPKPLAMMGGMGVGLASAFPLLGLFSFFLAGFEIVVMSIQIGMLAGMIGVMTGSNAVAPVVAAGAMSRLAIQFLLHLADRSVHGEVSRHD